MGFYESAGYAQALGLRAMKEDREIVYQVMALLKEKGVTVDRASRILDDALILIPLTTTLK